ncbi:hypothetical protein B296_00008258 [Ensete ventricosum]|uniref:Uncharacterized protein n=1 Tax=Ensete ventricosum TaxID=4639 RepID=A0A426ZK03_ENSVE|nr:hypothetical protein B296_00008258 [Ensete ventricosum]
MRGQRRAQLLQRRVAAIWSERALLVMFNLLLVAKEVGSKRSLLAAIKDDGSERLLLAVLCDEGSLLVAIKVDGSIVQQEMRVVVEGINGDLQLCELLGWVEATEMAVGVVGTQL